jgi:hypothetical protein
MCNIYDILKYELRTNEEGTQFNTIYEECSTCLKKCGLLDILLDPDLYNKNYNGQIFI